jgi:hypothetical protein
MTTIGMFNCHINKRHADHIFFGNKAIVDFLCRQAFKCALKNNQPLEIIRTSLEPLDPRPLEPFIRINPFKDDPNS